jgi:hypothetical protein
LFIGQFFDGKTPLCPASMVPSWNGRAIQTAMIPAKFTRCNTNLLPEGGGKARMIREAQPEGDFLKWKARRAQ